MDPLSAFATTLRACKKSIDLLGVESLEVFADG